MYSKKIVLCIALLATLLPHTYAGPRTSPLPAQITIQPAVTTNPTTVQGTIDPATAAKDTTGNATNPTTVQGTIDPAKTHSPPSPIKAEDAMKNYTETLKVFLDKPQACESQWKDVRRTINQSIGIVMHEIFEMLEKQKAQKSTPPKTEEEELVSLDNNLQRILALMDPMVPYIHTMLKTSSKEATVLDWLRANTNETAQQIAAGKNCRKDQWNAKEAGNTFLSVHERVQLKLNAPVGEKLADKAAPNQAKSSNTPDAMPPAKTIVRSIDNKP